MKSRTSTATNSNRRPEKQRARGLLPGRSDKVSRACGLPSAPAGDTGSTLLRVPGATYRLQFTRDFTLRDATALLDYLQALGVTDIYASPLFQAGPHSSHGYDVCCHGRISESLGGDEAFEQFTRELRRRGMGLLLDVVPNHMAASESNSWWWDVLKRGRASRFAKFFDIDWERGGGKVVLPVLGEELDKVLAEGHLSVSSEDDGLILNYFEKRFPLHEEPAQASLSRALLDAQHYRLLHWRRGPNEINYRRFFDVNELVALRMEEAGVFGETHRSVLDFVRQGAVQGLRVDHPDGLFDPKQYFERLQAAAATESRLYVVAEKILSGRERLPADWPVAGTTGYDFLNDVNGLFVASASEPAMTQLYREFTGNTEDFHEVAYRSKKLVLEKSFAGDVRWLAERLGAGAGVASEPLGAALVELIASLPVYRTYIRHETRTLSKADADVLQHACASARSRAPGLKRQLNFLERLLQPPWRDLRDKAALSDVLEFVMRFQQLTGPAAAKGVEDTAFYNYNRLVSLNEVGGEPAHFGIAVEEFHRGNLARAVASPHSLLATATHDTKRGEDARACINVLSEMPGPWRAAVLRWRELNSRYKTDVNGAPAPDANDEYLLYQNLVGAWDSQTPVAANRERFLQYMLKAIKEAKRHTSWTEPDARYESATDKFVTCILEDRAFLDEFLAFQRTPAFFGVFNSLAQTLLKLTAPGVPDIYQGTELQDFSLVDPDNRRPVDFELRRRLLAGKEREGISSKLFLIARALEFRNAHRELFDFGSYRPLTANTEHICAFARTFQGEQCLVVVPRLVYTLLGGTEQAPVGNQVWKNGTVEVSGVEPSAEAYRNVFTDETAVAENGKLRLSEVMATFPVALMEPV